MLQYLLLYLLPFRFFFFYFFYFNKFLIGKFFINRDIYPINIEEFIKQGINNYNNIDLLEINDYMEAIHYIKICEQMGDNKIKKM